MSRVSNAPQIRFKDFTDAWGQRKLGDIADIIGGGTPSTAVSEYWDGDIDWYAPAEIVDQIFVNSSQKKITTEGLNNSSAKMLPVGTVLFTSRAGIGKTAILSKEGCTNQGFQSIIPHKDELDSYFIFSRTDELKRYGETVGAGSTFVEVSGKQMANMTISIPTTIGEQRQIGTYFHNLDNLITLHQRKYNQVVNFKKAMLEKMFPKNGSDTPEIRFKGYTDAWEQRELGTMITVHPSKDLTVEAIESEGTSIVVQQGDSPILGYSDAEGFEGYINVTLFGDHTVSLYKPQLPFVVATDGVKILSSSILHHQYFYTVLEKYKPIPQGYKRHFSILKEQITNITVNKDEQKKIGEIFEIIDNLITLHQRKLQQLKHIKIAMLEKMFV